MYEESSLLRRAFLNYVGFTNKYWKKGKSALEEAQELKLKWTDQDGKQNKKSLLLIKS